MRVQQNNTGHNKTDRSSRWQRLQAKWQQPGYYEITVLLGLILVVGGVWGFVKLADEVLEGLGEGAARAEVVGLRGDEVGRVEREEGLPLHHRVAEAHEELDDAARERRGDARHARRIDLHGGGRFEGAPHGLQHGRLDDEAQPQRRARWHLDGVTASPGHLGLHRAMIHAMATATGREE